MSSITPIVIDSQRHNEHGSRPMCTGRSLRRNVSKEAATTWQSRVMAGMFSILCGRWLGPYRVIALILAGTLGVFLGLRIALLIGFADRANLDMAEVAWVLSTGFRFDLLVGLSLVLWQLVHLTFVPPHTLGRLNRWTIEFEWLIAFLLLPLTCLVEWLFFEEFQSRLNYIAFEYLVYPSEVCCNIWESYSVVPYLTAVGIVGGAAYLVLRRRFVRLLDTPTTWRQRWSLLFGTVAAMIGLWSTTGTADRHAASDRIAVECAGNGLYSFVYYAWTCRLDFDQNYVTLDEQAAVQRVRHEVVRPSDRLETDSANPVDRIVTSGRVRRDSNVVLILEESFGSDFVGELGDGRGLTPYFDQLCQDGILFDRMYATGNRTARALEAVLTSMPPIPTESILKRDHSDHVQTLADVLAKRGYERLFMTAGRGLFDGVRSFMTTNGFDEFLEQSDFHDPVFANAWGVSDEDLFRKALGEFDRLHATGRPFFTVLLTVSNHRPYTFPEGRIAENAQCRESAVKYADWAIGYFFREARQHKFFKNTVFVVIGDHGARIYGSQTFPIQSYRVPMLMILPQEEGRGTRCHTLGCSLDVAPTIMGQLGGEYRSVFFGADILDIPPEDGRALMQHNHDIALLNAQNELAILGFGESGQSFRLDPVSYRFEETNPPASEVLRNATALFQSAYHLYYSDRWFPSQPAEKPSYQASGR